MFPDARNAFLAFAVALYHNVNVMALNSEICDAMLSVRLPRGEMESVDAYAARFGVARSWLARRAIAVGLERMRLRGPAALLVASAGPARPPTTEARMPAPATDGEPAT